MVYTAFWFGVWKDFKPSQLLSLSTEFEIGGSNHLKKIVLWQFVEQSSKLGFRNQVISFIDCVLVQHLNRNLPQSFHRPSMVRPSPRNDLATSYVPFIIIDSVCFVRATYPWEEIIKSFVSSILTNIKQTQQLIPAFCSRSSLTIPSTDFLLRRIE